MTTQNSNEVDQDYAIESDYILQTGVNSQMRDEFIHANLTPEKIATAPLNLLQKECPQIYDLVEKIRKKVFEDLGAVYIANGGEHFDNDEDIRNFYLLVSRMIGIIDPHYGALYDVKSKTLRADQRVTVSQTSGVSPMHTDGSWLPQPPDVIGLLCLSAAMEGGENLLIHSHEVRKALEDKSLDILNILQQSFYRESATPGFIADKEHVLSSKFKIVHDCVGQSRIQYMRRWIEEGHVKAGESLTEEQEKALDAMDEVLQDENLLKEIPAKSYDILLMNNKTVLHTRKPFKDFEEEAKKRHMVRVWINKDPNAVTYNTFEQS